MDMTELDQILATLPRPAQTALLACAVPAWFNVEVLGALLDDPEAGRSGFYALTARPYASPDPDYPGAYRLEPAMRESLLERSYLDRPDDYRIWQERAYAYFTRVDQPAYEAARMAHLEELFYLFLASHALDELSTFLEGVDQVPLQNPSYRRRVDYYRAVLQTERCDYSAAQTGFERLLADPELDDALRARVLNSRGIAYRRQGRFEDAIDSYQAARSIFARLRDRLGEAKILTNLGIIHIELGEYHRALPLLEAGRAIFQEMKEPIREADALLELGITHGLLGHWQPAIACFQACLEIVQRLGISDRLARAHNNLAEVYFFMGRWDDAEATYRSALAIMQTPEHENRLGATETLMNLGFLAHTQNLYHQAEKRYQQASALAEVLNSDHHRILIGYRRADMYVQQGRLEAAFDELVRAVDVIEAMRGRQASESIRMSLFDTRQQVYQTMVLLCLDLDQPAEALTYVERAKSRAFLDMLARPDAPESLPVETPLTAAEIQARLPADAALVEFFTTGSAGPSATLLANLSPESRHLRDYLAPPERLLAFIVTRENLHVVELHGSIQQIEARHFSRSDGRLRGTTPLPGQRLRPMRRWHDLDAQLLQPIRPYLSDKQHVFLVPHSALHYLPLHALAGDAQLASRAETTYSYAPSASVLLRAGLSEPPASRDITCLAIGVNADGPSAAPSTGSGLRLRTSLAHAEAEAAWIARQLSGTATSTTLSTSLLGEAATPDAVCDALSGHNPSTGSGHRVIHFSCHGRFRRREPMSSGLALAGGELTAAEVLQSVRLGADIVTLSACDTGLNRLTHGDELLGLTRAFLGAGARSLLVALWPVHEIPTRLFMEHFYATWMGGASRAAALAEAQRYVRSMDAEALHARLADYGLSPSEITDLLDLFETMLPGRRPFDHPYYWGAFLLIGAPG